MGKISIAWVFIFTFISAVYAEENKNISIVDLEPIIVQANRTVSSQFSTANNVKITDKKKIEKLQVRNLSEALSYNSGVNIEPRRGFGTATSTSIQGSESRNVRVMIDGIPMNSQGSGQFNPSRLPIGNVEQIEVIKGAASNLWGSALGGVVNIVTKDTGKTLKPQIEYTSSYAEFHTQHQTMEVIGGAADFGYYSYGDFEESKGEDTRDDKTAKKTYNKISYDLKEKGKFLLAHGYSTGDINSGIYPDRSWQAQPYVNNYGKMSWGNEINDTNVKIDLKHSRASTITKTFDLSTDNNASDIARTKDRLYQVSIDTATVLNEDLFLLGADFDYDVLQSSSLTEAKSLGVEAPYASYKLGRFYPFECDFALRYDANSEFGSDFSPSLGSLYHLSLLENTVARFVISRAFHAPPLLWKYYDRTLSFLTVNNDIEPETAVVMESGIESKINSRISGKLSFYNSDVKKALASAQNENGEFYMKNFRKFRRRGVELESRLKIFEELSLSASGEMNDIQNMDTKKQVRGRGIPRQRYSFDLEYNNNQRGFVVNLLSSLNRWDSNASAEPNDRKFIFDLKMSKSASYGPAIDLDFFLNVYNITNSKYWSDIFFPIPERYFESGVKIKW